MTENETQNCVGLLKTTVRQLLALRDLPTADAFQVKFFDSGAVDIQSQIAEQNAFWRVELGLHKGTQSMDARQALVDNISMDEWLRLFQRYVLPLVCRLDLRFKR